MLFAALLLAHLLYDFHWQGAFIAQEKSRYVFLLCIHVLTWTLLLAFVLVFFGAFAPWKAVVLFVSHLASDRWKSRLPKTPEWFWAIYIDQAIHLVSLIIVLF